MTHLERGKAQRPPRAKSSALAAERLARAGLVRLSPETLKRLRDAGQAFTVRKDRKVSGRVSADLLATVKQRLGVVSDTEAIEMALVNLALTDDFGAWLVDQGGRLDEDFTLEL